MRRRGLEIAVRLVLASILLLVLFLVLEQSIVEAILPLFRWELGQLDDRYRILFFGLATQSADGVIRLDVTLVRPVVVGTHVVMPDPRGFATVTTLSGNLLQPAVLMLALLAAWPARGSLEYLVRVACGLPLLILLLMADIPFVLLAQIWAMLVESHAPGQFSPLLTWSAFLESGGRMALALALAALTIALGRRMAMGRSGLNHAEGTRRSRSSAA
jgi:hypothetical protein